MRVFVDVKRVYDVYGIHRCVEDVDVVFGEDRIECVVHFVDNKDVVSVVQFTVVDKKRFVFGDDELVRA